MSLIIIATFKGQGNETLKKLRVVVLVPNNLTNKFQPLDLTVNKPAKGFLSEKYNHWYSDEVSKQLRRNINPTDVNINNIWKDLTAVLYHLIKTKNQSGI